MRRIMSTKRLAALALYIIGLLMAATSLYFAYAGLPAGYDTEPLLAVAVILVAVGGLVSLRD